MSTGYRIASPLGDIVVRVDGDDLTGLYFFGQKHFPVLTMATDVAALPAVVRQAQDEMAEYFLGQRRQFGVPFQLHGTPFQQRVWQALLTIPYGEVASYGDIAEQLGLHSGASRAVGSANSRNPISVIVPCHRVIASNGELTGYAGGLQRKHALLMLEQRDRQTEFVLQSQ